MSSICKERVIVAKWPLSNWTDQRKLLACTCVTFASRPQAAKSGSIRLHLKSKDVQLIELRPSLFLKKRATNAVFSRFQSADERVCCRLFRRSKSSYCRRWYVLTVCIYFPAMMRTSCNKLDIRKLRYTGTCILMIYSFVVYQISHQQTCWIFSHVLWLLSTV